ncbi:FAD-binding oxidoreductase [Actinomadura logoneensis]|uniref:FAD-binding oxidoreductase n=1 Tax=Actinomadura logoneensis TaxID=2293572 RepID=A0A372JPS3_9ACTN|nr:FAD-binding oxidoreductase [Actinomadura logoneensis]RFU41764.1 FAD-binding oxidoreductase [Actinomadura logoneensis]
MALERRTFLLAAGAGILAGCSSSPGKPAPARTSRASPTGPADWNALARGLHGRVVRPGDADYDRARRLYIPRFDDVRPAGIAYCAQPSDVAECMAFAARQRIPVAVRSGGHNYAGWSTGTGLVIDVSPMDAIDIGGGHATVGAGVRLIDLYARLGARGLTVPGGSCPTVSVSGLTLGGGLGATSRAFGLTCDAVESLRIVTPDGVLRECDASREPDLFWACRGGGGGNFGVAVGFTYRTHRVPDQVTPFTMSWPRSRAAEALRGWQRWLPSAPDEVWTSFQLDATRGVSVEGFALSDPSGPTDALAAAVGGASPDLAAHPQSYTDAMLRLAGCVGQTVDECHAQGRLPGQHVAGRFPRTDYTAKSHMARRPLPDDAIESLVRRVRGRDGRSVLLDAMGGAIGRVAPSATAFPHRDALFSAQYLAPSDDMAWLRGVHGAMDPYLRGAAYVNYTDPELASWRTDYYGANAGRLGAVKAKYDPNALLRFPQAITPA